MAFNSQHKKTVVVEGFIETRDSEVFVKTKQTSKRSKTDAIKTSDESGKSNLVRHC